MERQQQEIAEILQHNSQQNSQQQDGMKQPGDFQGNAALSQVGAPLQSQNPAMVAQS